jgi:hypothetical protein
LNIDNVLSFVGSETFHYEPTGKWNHKSVATDKLTFEGLCCQIFSGTEADARSVAADFKVDEKSTGTLKLKLRDGAAGDKYDVKIRLDPDEVKIRKSSLQKPAAVKAGQ